MSITNISTELQLLILQPLVQPDEDINHPFALTVTEDALRGLTREARQTLDREQNCPTNKSKLTVVSDRSRLTLSNCLLPYTTLRCFAGIGSRLSNPQLESLGGARGVLVMLSDLFDDALPITPATADIALDIAVSLPTSVDVYCTGDTTSAGLTVYDVYSQITLLDEDEVACMDEEEETALRDCMGWAKSAEGQTVALGLDHDLRTAVANKK